MNGRDASLLFELRVARIRNEAAQVASLIKLLARLNHHTEAMDEYDLRASAENLRDAAAKLDEISQRSKENGTLVQAS